jgi:hypothetical protein
LVLTKPGQTRCTCTLVAASSWCKLSESETICAGAASDVARASRSARHGAVCAEMVDESAARGRLRRAKQEGWGRGLYGVLRHAVHRAAFQEALDGRDVDNMASGHQASHAHARR